MGWCLNAVCLCCDVWFCIVYVCLCTTTADFSTSRNEDGNNLLLVLAVVAVIALVAYVAFMTMKG